MPDSHCILEALIAIELTIFLLMVDSHWKKQGSSMKKGETSATLIERIAQKTKPEPENSSSVSDEKLHCAHCQCALGEPIKELAYAKESVRVYVCQQCKKETLISVKV
jgi:predicted SprT family Zn-dependent metalloprotease